MSFGISGDIMRARVKIALILAALLLGWPQTILRLESLIAPEL